LYLRHVHVIDEVDEALRSRRAVVSSGLLLERLLHDVLQHLGRGVEVERDVGDHVIVLGQTVDAVVDEHRLAGPGSTDQHRRTLPVQQQVEEVAKPRRLGRVHKRCLRPSNHPHHCQQKKVKASQVPILDTECWARS